MRSSTVYKRVVCKILPPRQLTGVYLPMNEDAHRCQLPNLGAQRVRS